MREVHIVLGGGLVIECYERKVDAERHARLISGAEVKSFTLHAFLPSSVRSDLEWAAEWHDGDEEDTPVFEIIIEEEV